MNGVVFAETLRRHVTNAGYLIYVGFLVIVALGVSRFNQPGAAWPSLVALLAIIAGSGPIGPEFSSGTLQLILVKPVKRWEYLLSRVAGVVIAVLIVAVVAGSVEWIGRLLWADIAAPERIGAAILNCGVDALLTASLLVLLGSLTRAYFNVAIYLGVEFGLMAFIAVLGFLRAADTPIGRILVRYPAIERSLWQIDRILFPEFPPAFNARWVVSALTTAAIALALACIVFRRREVPYGAD